MSEEQVQSVTVPRSLAVTVEQAWDVVRDKGWDASVVEETEDGYLFRQAAGCACGAGYGGVVCDEHGCRVVRGPICQCQGHKGNLDATGRDSGKTGEKAMPYDEDRRPMDDDEDEGGNGGRDEEEAPEEKPMTKLAGALWLRGLRAYAKAADETVEHTGIKRLSKRVVKWGSRAARKFYQGMDLGYMDEDDGGPPETGDEEEEEDDGDEEKPSEEEKAVLSAFNRVMGDLFGQRKDYGRSLTNKSNGR